MLIEQRWPPLIQRTSIYKQKDEALAKILTKQMKTMLTLWS